MPVARGVPGWRPHGTSGNKQAGSVAVCSR